MCKVNAQTSGNSQELPACLFNVHTKFKGLVHENTILRSVGYSCSAASGKVAFTRKLSTGVVETTWNRDKVI